MEYAPFGFYSLVYQLCVMREFIKKSSVNEIVSLLENMDRLLSVHEYVVEAQAEYWIGNDDASGTLMHVAQMLVDEILLVADRRLVGNDPIDLHQPSESSTSAKRPNFPQWIHDVLREWLENHLENPYPAEEEKELLMNKTQLTMSQINNYFINARRRLVPLLKKQRMK
jgi:hypothetical protein